ncbi:unnamed protein product [Trichogramma brassicae]|uniref:RRM domain-containing protein n=1 Tax=Trichogramma brassicae TaxID=86971 RepID=A0A6H5I6R0_9HYME|nr:unnamed protein product [Trichogramma brassicae]
MQRSRREDWQSNRRIHIISNAISDVQQESYIRERRPFGRIKNKKFGANVKGGGTGGSPSARQSGSVEQRRLCFYQNVTMKTGTDPSFSTSFRNCFCPFTNNINNTTNRHHRLVEHHSKTRHTHPLAVVAVDPPMPSRPKEVIINIVNHPLIIRIIRITDKTVIHRVDPVRAIKIMVVMVPMAPVITTAVEVMAVRVLVAKRVVMEAKVAVVATVVDMEVKAVVVMEDKEVAVVASIEEDLEDMEAEVVEEAVVEADMAAVGVEAEMTAGLVDMVETEVAITRGYGSDQGSDNMVTQEDTIFVSGMDSQITEEEICQHFGAIGLIKLSIKANGKAVGALLLVEEVAVVEEAVVEAAVAVSVAVAVVVAAAIEIVEAAEMIIAVAVVVAVVIGEAEVVELDLEVVTGRVPIQAVAIRISPGVTSAIFAKVKSPKVWVEAAVVAEAEVDSEVAEMAAVEAVVDSEVAETVVDEVEVWIAVVAEAEVDSAVTEEDEVIEVVDVEAPCVEVEGCLLSLVEKRQVNEHPLVMILVSIAPLYHEIDHLSF